MIDPGESKDLRIARLDLVNAQEAVKALPTIQARAESVVADARRRLELAEAELQRVIEVETPAAHSRVGELTELIARLQQGE